MKFATKLGIPFAILGLMLAHLVLNSGLRTLDAPVVLGGLDEGGRKWDPRIFRILSFGFLPASIDWQWIKVLLDPSVSRLPRGVHPSIYYDLDLVTELDPAFFEVYYTGSQLLAIVRDDPFGARDLLLKAERFRKIGLPVWPEEYRRHFWRGGWYLSVALAYIYLFELDDMPKAAEAFREASLQPGSPPYLKPLSERLSKPGGHYEVGLKVLNFLLTDTADEKVKARLERKREWLYVSQYVFDLNHAFAEYRKQHPKLQSDLMRAWAEYRKETRLAMTDPWGGLLSLDPSTGKIKTSTPYEKVFGLE